MLIKQKKNKNIVIYDDSFQKSEVIEDIIGEKGFGDVIVKRKTLFDYYYENIAEELQEAQWIKVNSVYSLEEISEEILEKYDNQCKVYHCFSNFIISDEKKAKNTILELNDCKEATKVNVNGKSVMLFFPSLLEYADFLGKGIENELLPNEMLREISNTYEGTGYTDISIVSNFITCITGNFDSRYFNSLSGDDYIIKKSSTNKKKILREYTYYRLLPDDMKYWFIMPFNYTENEEKATYSMERLHMTDLAIKWVHGSIDEKEFEFILDKYFYFFDARHSKNITATEYKKIADDLYITKVEQRIEELKKLDAYKNIAQILEAGTELQSIDAIVQKYFELKLKIEEKTQFPLISVIGHGDPCFANALYNKSTKMLKLIDPKGALNEDELWTNPYYDVAKLSHSICGRYDFFNNALFEININDDMKCELTIPFDNRKFIDIFKNKLKEHRYDYNCVRLYEASLFLSMLPLHIDNPQKVLGFILNANTILKELEKNV